MEHVHPEVFYATPNSMQSDASSPPHKRRHLNDSISMKWVKNSVFYQIFPDRFARPLNKTGMYQSWNDVPKEKGYKGGDLDGLVKNGIESGYLSFIGINGIYTCPIFASASNHRYHTHDYYQVDEMLGGNKEFEKALNVAHEHGFKWILDGVFNHASRSFFQFADLLENGKDSAYFDWWILDNPQKPKLAPYPCPEKHAVCKPGYACWWGIPALPKFQTNTQAVRDFLWNVAEYWIKFGIDGWRLDVPNEIDDDSFWLQFRHFVKSASKEAYIVGEIWEDAGRWLQPLHHLTEESRKEPLFDACMNYPWTRLVLGFVACRHDGDTLLNGEFLKRTGLEYTKLVHTGKQWFEGMEATFPDKVNGYPWETILNQFNLLGSHDTPRVTSVLTQGAYTEMFGSWQSLYLAYLLQMTTPGVPCIYYGDEVGLLGGRDPECRGGMPWPGTFPYPLPGPRWNTMLLHHVTRMIHLRNGLTSLREGCWVRLLGEKERIIVFARGLPDQVPVVIVVNAEKSRLQVDFDVSQIPGVEDGDLQWVDLSGLTKTLVETKVGNAKDLYICPREYLGEYRNGFNLHLDVEGMSGMILVPVGRVPEGLMEGIERDVARLKSMEVW